MHFRIILLFIALFLQSCIKNIDSKLLDIKPIPTINCILNPDSICSAYLCFSNSILSDTFVPINNAKVYIYKNNILFDSLQQQKGIYYKGHLYPDMDALYTLKVFSNNKVYEAITSIPTNGVLDSVIYFKKSIGTFDVRKIIYFENMPSTNFYEYFYGYGAKKRLYDSSGNYLGYTRELVYSRFLEENEGFNITLDPRIINEVNLKLYPTTIVFSDVNFNTQQIGLFIDNMYIINALDVPIVSVLRSTSKEYYEYRRSNITHVYNSKLHYNGTYKTIGAFIFPLEPTKMYNNMQGGALGVFAGYSQDTCTINRY
jgi:hypothetical protein